MQQLHAAQSEISTAVSQNGRLDPQKYHLPVAVWADVVAEEISQQKLTDLRTKELLYKVQNPSYAAQINTKLKR